MAITRTWRDWTAAADADDYQAFLLDELFPSMRSISGFLEWKCSAGSTARKSRS